MKIIKNNIFFSTLQNVNKILLPSHKKDSIKIFFMVMFSSVLEVLGLAVVLPVITIVLNRSVIHTNKYLNSFYDALGFTSENQFALFLLLGLFLVFLIKNGLALIITFWQSKFSLKISTDVAQMQFKRYYFKDLQFFNDHNSNLLMRNIRAVSGWVSAFILLPIIGFISELIVVVMIITGMAMYDFKIFLLISVSLVPVFLLIYRLIKNKVQLIETNRSYDEVEAIKNLQQGIVGYIDVKLSNKDNYFINQYIHYQEKINNAQSKILTLQNFPTKVIELTAVSGVILIIIYSIMIQQTDKGLLALLSLYVIAAYRLMPSMNRMLISLVSIKGYQFLFDIIKDVKVESNYEVKQEKQAISFEKSIQIQGLHFKYPSSASYTLKDIDFSINKGEKVGIIGQSGSGKTTLINILLRFLQEESGTILIDGKIPLTQENINVWRDLIGYVKQNVFIVDGDFYENIAFGIDRKDVDQEKMEKAVKSAQLDAVVNKLPQGLNANIGENGTRLSGGQRQRIAIARALYKDAQILIFDEATSALDNETEREITEAINSVSLENKTMIIIAHRISTLKNCDCIYEMKDGEIISKKNYSELIHRIL